MFVVNNNMSLAENVTVNKGRVIGFPYRLLATRICQLARTPHSVKYWKRVQKQDDKFKTVLFHIFFRFHTTLVVRPLKIAYELVLRDVPPYLCWWYGNKFKKQ